MMERLRDDEHQLLRNSKGTIRELREILSNEQSRYEHALFNEKRRREDLEQSMQGQFRSVTQEHVLVNEARKYLEKGRSANERLRHRLEEARALVDANTALLRDEEVRLRQEKAAHESNIHRAYKELERQWTQIQVERSVLVGPTTTSPSLKKLFPGSSQCDVGTILQEPPSTCSTVPTDAHIPAPGSYPSTPRTSDLPSFMQHTEIVTESAAPGVPPSFLVQESAHQPFMPLGAPQSQPYRGPVQFSVSEEYYRASGGGGHGYSPGPPESCGSGGGGSGGSSGGG
ncbi:hypothetical protein DYB36_013899 [Aphanomyces astaci]|uniref:Uncharacterized protein n=1 Tax=Aphanomyces astaci TaxID=112090 RepID=A0A396ZW22_APHAT|nr:hypothetical protein DYB36_013899 [Aphanomyces astaci]